MYVLNFLFKFKILIRIINDFEFLLKKCQFLVASGICNLKEVYNFLCILCYVQP